MRGCQGNERPLLPSAGRLNQCGGAGQLDIVFANKTTTGLVRLNDDDDDEPIDNRIS